MTKYTGTMLLSISNILLFIISVYLCLAVCKWLLAVKQLLFDSSLFTFYLDYLLPVLLLLLFCCGTCIAYLFMHYMHPISSSYLRYNLFSKQISNISHFVCDVSIKLLKHINLDYSGLKIYFGNNNDDKYTGTILLSINNILLFIISVYLCFAACKWLLTINNFFCVTPVCARFIWIICYLCYCDYCFVVVLA